MTRGKSFITAFTSSLPRLPMEPVGQASKARSACRRSALETGCALTKHVSAASPNTAGAICRHASQSMQVESTKKSPVTFSGTRFLGFAMTEPPAIILRLRRFRIASSKRQNRVGSEKKIGWTVSGLSGFDAEHRQRAKREHGRQPGPSVAEVVDGETKRQRIRRR